jgi:hypothetical protein
MKFNFSLLTLFFASITAAFAQNIDLRWAEKIPTRKNFVILGGNQLNYYTTHLDKDNRLIGRVYDASLNLKIEKPIDFNLSSKKYSYLGAVLIQDKITHFIKDVDRKENVAAIYAAHSDGNLNPSEQINIIDEVDKNSKTDYMGARRISPDSSKIVMFHADNLPRGEREISYKVYSSNFSTLLHKGSIVLPPRKLSFMIQNVAIDNSGNVFVLGRLEKTKDERSKGDSRYYYALYAVTPDKKTKEFEFDYPEKNIVSMDVIVGKNNELYCAGFLATTKKNSKYFLTDHMFFAKMNTTSFEITSSKMSSLSKLYPERVGRADNLSYLVKDIFEKEDGGFLVIGEQYQEVVVRSKYGTSVTRYYADIAAITTDKEGILTRVSKIPKMQVSVRNPSIIATFKDDNCYILYEDHKKNANVREDKKIKPIKGLSSSAHSVFLLTVKPDGTVQKKEVYNFKEVNIKPDWANSTNIGNGTILLYANDQFGVFKVN